MSCRCQIGLYEENRQPLNKPDALIYRHGDGYPGCVLPDLVESMKQLEQDGYLYDMEKCGAKILYDMIHRIYNFRTGSYGSYAGYGISNLFHADIDYFYAVYSSGRVKVFRVINPWLLDEEGKGVRLLRTVLIQEVEIQNDEVVKVMTLKKPKKEKIK